MTVIVGALELIGKRSDSLILTNTAHRFYLCKKKIFFFIIKNSQWKIHDGISDLKSLVGTRQYMSIHQKKKKRRR